MSPQMETFISLDLPAMLAGTLAALACALLGNFLVLRRQAMMGDAISHAVLPGIVVGFLIAGSRSTWPIFLGAGVSALVTVMMISALRRVARVEAGAAMGVSFSIMFALGVLLIEQSTARGVDLDAGCVLYGQLEYINWYPPTDWGEFWSAGTLDLIPRQVVVLLGAVGVIALFVGVFFKELRITTFDPAHASAIGINSGLMGAVLMTLVAGATVAAFEAVGSILVIAMLITPPATARLLTDRYSTQILLSVGFAVVTGVLGYLVGAFLPSALGFEGMALNIAGTMTIVGVLMLIGAIFASPSHGVIARAVRRRRLARQIARDDILALLFRLEEIRPDHAMLDDQLREATGHTQARAALRELVSRGHVERTNKGLALRDSGRALARGVVRSHRLWESWLVDTLGLRADHVHQTAERLEHLRDAGRPIEPGEPGREFDPHDRPIPDRDDPETPRSGRE